MSDAGHVALIYIFFHIAETIIFKNVSLKNADNSVRTVSLFAFSIIQRYGNFVVSLTFIYFFHGITLLIGHKVLK